MESLRSLKQQDLSLSHDSAFLREQARQQVEKLAGELWTDYNSHDPGITLLEMLAYAITELGLRSDHKMVDLLAGEDTEHSFYSAREILAGTTVTEDDYRQLLLSLPGVQDAHFADFEEKVDSCSLQGLSQLRILFSGELNESWTEQEISVDNEFSTSAYFVPPIWKDLHKHLHSGERITAITGLDDVVLLPNEDDSRLNNGSLLYINAFVTVTDEAANNRQLEFGTWIYIQEAVRRDISEEEPVLIYLISEDGTEPTIEDLFSRFLVRIENLETQISNINALLNKHRNLSEDWVLIEPVRIQQIAVSIEELELEAQAEPEEVIAQIYFQLQLFIEPHIRPHTLEQLLADDQQPAEIFQGILADTGFIQQQDLKGLDRGNSLYTSDLIQLIMQVPGVFALSGLSLKSFVDRLLINEGVNNCLDLLDKGFYPRFSVNDSNIRLFRRGVVIEADMLVVNDRLKELHQAFLDSFPKGSETKDILPPSGQTLALESYYSIQNDFPQTYRLREGEITSDMPPQRKAQAKQLKAYLLFFEQVLANYCSQLANIDNLFSINKAIERTYFYQPLYQVPAVQELFQAFVDEQSDGALSWQQFQQNCNAYIKTLNFAAEDQQTFRERRALFVEHLMARFGESFGDYADWVLLQNGGQVSSDLIMDQLDFLQNLPELGAKRAAAFDTTATRINEADVVEADVWDSDNVSGLEKRVAGLLGMPNYRRRSLGEIFNINDYLEIYDQEGPPDDRSGGRFRFWNTKEEERSHSRSKILLSSNKHYSSNVVLHREIDNINKSFAQQSRYYAVAQTKPTRSSKCKYYINLLDDSLNENDPIAGRLNYYPSNRAVVEQEIQQTIHLMQGRYAEGMHVLEHILLRPIQDSEDNAALEPVSFDLSEGGGSATETFVTDPYSFQVSILLPGWAPRFKDQEFRAIVERTLREEMPAHILPWIYWVKSETGVNSETGEEEEQVPAVFNRFEIAYKEWLKILQTGQRRVSRQNALITVFNELRSHPCMELTNQSAYKAFSFER